VAECINNIQNDLMNQLKSSSKIFQAHFMAVDAAIMEVKNGFWKKKTAVFVV
jgi:hypothetical protein